MDKNKKEYYCHFELTLDIIGGKWKPIILYYLGKHEVLRYSEIRQCMPTVSERVLCRKLEELLNSKLISKKSYDQVPPKVEYRLTDSGEKVIPILNELKEWGKEYNNEIGNMKVMSINEREELKKEL